jgi:hypothetical protein
MDTIMMLLTFLLAAMVFGVVVLVMSLIKKTGSSHVYNSCGSGHGNCQREPEVSVPIVDATRSKPKIKEK